MNLIFEYGIFFAQKSCIDRRVQGLGCKNRKDTNVKHSHKSFSVPLFGHDPVPLFVKYTLQSQALFILLALLLTVLFFLANEPDWVQFALGQPFKSVSRSTNNNIVSSVFAGETSNGLVTDLELFTLYRRVIRLWTTSRPLICRATWGTSWSCRTSRSHTSSLGTVVWNTSSLGNLVRHTQLRIQWSMLAKVPRTEWANSSNSCRY